MLECVGRGLLVLAFVHDAVCSCGRGIVAVGNDGAGDVTVSNGMRLEAGDVIIMEFVGDLANIIVDVAVNGEGVAWLALNA